MATRQVLAELARGLRAARRACAVAIESVGGVDAARRVQAGEAFDVVVLASDAIDKLHRRRARACRQQGRPGALRRGGLRARRRAAARHRFSEDALKRAVLAARSIGYSTGPSGVALAQAVRALGHRRSEIAGRTVQAPPGVPVGTLVARGEVALGFQQLSELMHLEGIDRGGPAARRRSRSPPSFPPASCAGSAQAERGARACWPSWPRRRPPRPSAATAWNRPEPASVHTRRHRRHMSLIIDCHGHYTTAPKALEDWRNQQIAGIKDPAADAQGGRPEDQRRRAARVHRDQPAAPDEGARQRHHAVLAARQLHGAPHRRLQRVVAPGRRSATSCASASASCSPTTSCRWRCCRSRRASTRRPASPSWRSASRSTATSAST